ncbi:MAG: hypothetical protein WD081_08970 [Gammaproteobacteria bacterium]
MTNLSYMERNIWGSLVALFMGAYWLLSDAIPAFIAGTPPAPERLAPWVFAIFLMVLAIELAYHVTLSFCARRDRRDERDTLIEAKAGRNGYYVLGGGLIGLGVHLAIWQLIGADPAMNLSFGIVAIVTLLIVAESSHLVSKLVYYRRGV